MKLSEIRAACETAERDLVACRASDPGEFLVIARQALPLLLKAIDGISEEHMGEQDVAELLEWAGIEVD